MSIIVVGSVAYDTIIAPSGSRSDALGGSATYFSVSCSYFTPVTIVAIVGEDFDSKHINLLKEHGVDTTGIAYKTGKTFRWSGEYDSNDINIRTTLDTQLNVLEAFDPSLTQQQSQIPYLFLANGDPEMQHSVLSQMNPRPRLVCLDSMNFWIELKNNSLLIFFNIHPNLIATSLDHIFFLFSPNVLNLFFAILKISYFPKFNKYPLLFNSLLRKSNVSINSFSFLRLQLILTI